LLLSVTQNGAKALEKDAGVLTETKDADMIILQLPNGVKNLDALALGLILHTKQAEEIFIAGVRQTCTF
jgi:cytosine/adenosine deaminase-related metal-dependent hydrolase